MFNAGENCGRDGVENDRDIGRIWQCNELKIF